MKVLAALHLLLVVSGNVRGAASAPRAALDEDFGYVEVRTGAHMFWVTYHVDQPGDWTKYPLIMWLQGGPGVSGVGYGNFEELGPYYANGSLRETAWTKKANLMFVDNPVGTGYSYVEDWHLLTKTNQEIADDLVALLTSVFAEYPEMSMMPFFVYAESYGGKMTVDFALALDQAIKSGKIACNFRGVSLGDSWISPMDSVSTWGPYLYNLGFVNRQGEESINAVARRAQAAVDAGHWRDATQLLFEAENAVWQQAGSIDFYNVLTPRLKGSQIRYSALGLYDSRQKIRNLIGRRRRDDRRPKAGRMENLSQFMNGPMARRWRIPDGVWWLDSSEDVFSALKEDFMKPVVKSVVALLETTDVFVAVSTGDLDLICDTPGTYRWVENMQWSGKANFDSTDRFDLDTNGRNVGYGQKVKNFAVFTILNSGHMVPIDAPEAALRMVELITVFGEERTSSLTDEKVHGMVHKSIRKKEQDKDLEEHKNEVPAEESFSKIIVQGRRIQHLTKNFQRMDFGVADFPINDEFSSDVFESKPSILMSKMLSVVYGRADESVGSSPSEVPAIHGSERFVQDILSRRFPDSTDSDGTLDLH